MTELIDPRSRSSPRNPAVGSVPPDRPACWTRLLSSTTAWAMLLCVLGVGAGFLPWVRIKIFAHPSGMQGPETWVEAPPSNGFQSWQGITITATFLALGLFLIAAGSLPRSRRWQVVALLLAGSAVLALSVLFLDRVEHGPALWYSGSDPLGQVLARALASKVQASPHLGPSVAAALAVGLLVLGMLDLRGLLLGMNRHVESGAGGSQAPAHPPEPAPEAPGGKGDSPARVRVQWLAIGMLATGVLSGAA